MGYQRRVHGEEDDVYLWIDEQFAYFADHAHVYPFIIMCPGLLICMFSDDMLEVINCSRGKVARLQSHYYSTLIKYIEILIDRFEKGCTVLGFPSSNADIFPHPGAHIAGLEKKLLEFDAQAMMTIKKNMQNKH